MDLRNEYQEIAQQLLRSETMSEAIEALEPITSQPDEIQTSFLKFLGKEFNIESANILQAIHTLSDSKLVRKEARRRLIQLENKNVYATWTPPAGPSLSQALEQLTNPALNADNSAVVELESLFSDLGFGDMFSEPEYIDLIDNYLDSWQEGDGAGAYLCLSAGSPLRANLTEELWAEQFEHWHTAAAPKGLTTIFMEPIKDEQGQDTNQISVGWSIELSNSTVTPFVQGLVPQATAVLQENGRHWFWTRFELVENTETDELEIQNISDEGARLLSLSTTELENGLANLTDQIANLNDEDEDYEIIPAQEDEDEEDEDEEDEDEEDDYDEDEEEENALSSLLETGINLAAQTLYYYDVLVAQDNTNEELYVRPFELAHSIDELEHAAFYMQEYAAHVPGKRSTGLRNVGLIYLQLAEQALAEAQVVDEDEDADDEEEINQEYLEQQAQQFFAASERVLREAVAIDPRPFVATALANFLVHRRQKLDEAAALLHKAETEATDPEDRYEIEIGLAIIHREQNEPAEELKRYQNAIQLKPENQDLWLQIGMTQKKLHNYDDAITTLQNCIDTMPTMIQAYTELAKIYLEQNAESKARATLKAAREMDAQDPEVLALLTQTYLKRGDLRTAHRFLEQAEMFDEENEVVQETRQLYNAQREQQHASSKNTTQKRSPKKR
ncbi:MAG TPA: tetratricopeptide repeat protein [Dictyobacter sp.]|nr:tetratricopeptide repeat protein [Dictyobacter sp.]